MIIQEDIQYGERVRAYKIEGYVNGKWTILSEGKSIGHKRIEKFETQNIQKLRLSITSSIDQPLIKNLSVLYIDKSL